MALKSKGGATKGSKRGISRPAPASSATKGKKKGGKPPPPTQHKPKKPTPSQQKRKPPHARYTEADLKLPALNGIRPAGVQKAANRKKGKQFVDDASMRTILAMVMAEKEGNIESKMIKARHLEALREARRAEAEERAASKKERFEERKSELKKDKKKKGKAADAAPEIEQAAASSTKARKRVSFG